MSGGGPHVLACAALLPGLVTAAASLASVAPYGAEGLDYYAGMGEENADDDRLFFTDQAAARAKTDKDREEILATPPQDAAKAIESLLTPADAAVLRGGLAEYLASSERDALAPGSQGWWDDNCTLRPWGFDLADITIPVLLLHGRQDMFVPFGHGEWLAAHIPGVEARLLDGDGHLTLLQARVPEVHAWLSEHL
jgi:pimeloyl-ACP methyl ester carboxylesterase